MAYLDDTGLAYFWGKIKAWANSVFALLGHTHPSSDVTLMTGYSMPSSTGAISASDTLNQAVGKLEKGAAVLDAGVVHTTGDETVAGRKTFNPSLDSGSTFDSAYTLFRNTAFDRTAPEAGKTYYNSIVFGDSSHNVEAYNSIGRMGILSFNFSSDGYSNAELSTRYYESGTAFENELATFRVGFQPDGTKFAMAPSTPDPSVRNDDEDILTRNWIPKDGRIVHTTGDEDVYGLKTFRSAFTNFASSSDACGLRIFNSAAVRSSVPSSALSFRLQYCDKNWDWLGLLEFLRDTNSSVTASIQAYNASGSHVTLQVGYDENGQAFATCPGTSSARTSGNDIVTRGWIPNDTRIVHTTGEESVGGFKHFTDSFSLDRDYASVYRTTTNHTATQLPGNVDWVGGFIWQDKNRRQFVGVEPYISSTHLDFNLSLTGCDSTGNYKAGLVLSLKHTGGEEVCRPRFNNQMTLGNGSFRWRQLFAVTATINTSDERVKRSVSSIPDAVLDAWGDVGWIQFQFADAVEEKGAGARLHAGLVAQRIAEAFSGRGIDETRYAFFCHDVWDAVPEKLDRDGSVLEEAVPAGDLYSLRYEEALCMEAAYMRRENARLKKRVADLEERLAALELRLGSE